MIYTSYMGNLKNVPENLKKISIMRFTPEWSDKYIDGERIDLAPKKEDLMAYLNGSISEEEYTVRYEKVLNRISVKKLAKELAGSVLLCTCKLGHFCHRHLLSEYLRSKKIRVSELETTDSYKDMSVEVLDKITPAICNKNPNKIYVFGDNMIGKGKAGQAVIRDCPNAFGIPTKRYPSMKEGSFFKDTLKDKVVVAIRLMKLRNMAYNGRTIVFPTAGIGTGLADLGHNAPNIFIYMSNFLEKNFLKFKVTEADKVRIIVAGSRTVRDYQLVSDALDEYLKTKKFPVIITGLAPGPDKYGYRYAKKHKIPYEEFPADWDKHGKAAGYIRNAEMAEVADELLAFYDGKSKGTQHMIDIAKKKKIKTKIILVKKK